MIRFTPPALVLLAALAQGQGHSIDLKGMVRDRASGLGISNAEVSLSHRGLKDTSDSQGRFRIYQPPRGLPWSERFGKAGSPVFLAGRGILLRNAVPGPVHLRILDITGKIHGKASADLGAGIWLMDPGKLKPGAYVGIVNTVANRQSFRFVALNSDFANAGVPPTLLPDESGPLSEDAADTSAVDSIKVVKTGYFPTVSGLTGFIDSNLVVELDAPSGNADLSNLVLSAGTLTPAFGSGTTTYNAAVADFVDSIALTPTAAGAGATITVNGDTVSSGSASGAIALAAGGDTVVTVVTAQDGSTRRTYTVIVTRSPGNDERKWIDSWAASFLSTTVNGRVQYAPSFDNQTYRLNVFTKLGGTRVRVKFTNKFGTNPLAIGSAHVAICPTGNSIASASDRKLTFGGADSLALAPGAEAWSDPVALEVAQHITVSISVYIPGSFMPTTFHPTGLHTSYISSHGDFTAATTLPLGEAGGTTAQVVIISGVQVWAPSTSRVAVAFGNSITDGTGATNDANGTWPDVLSERLPVLPSGAPFAVINMGIGSNRVVSSDLAGPSGAHRFADDVLARPNVRYVILLEGINDISYENADDATITDAYATMVAQAHAAGIKVYGATLLPIGNSVKYTEENETTRQAVNAWIRTPGNFDAVLDFEAVVRDTTAKPLRIKSDLTFDYVHPNALGYQAIGNSIPTGLFED